MIVNSYPYNNLLSLAMKLTVFQVYAFFFQQKLSQPHFSRQTFTKNTTDSPTSVARFPFNYLKSYEQIND